jgi:hypothetical protein
MPTTYALGKDVNKHTLGELAFANSARNPEIHVTGSKPGRYLALPRRRAVIFHAPLIPVASMDSLTKEFLASRTKCQDDLPHRPSDRPPSSRMMQENPVLLKARTCRDSSHKNAFTQRSPQHLYDAGIPGLAFEGFQGHLPKT